MDLTTWYQNDPHLTDDSFFDRQEKPRGIIKKNSNMQYSGGAKEDLSTQHTSDDQRKPTVKKNQVSEFSVELGISKEKQSINVSGPLESKEGMD